MSATPVSKEAIKLLVIQHGQREAARIAGLNEDTVCSWAYRYGWETASKPQARTGNTRLVDSVQASLAEDERETRLSLSRSARKLATEAESAKLRQVGDVHKVAQVMAIVHRQDQDKPGAQFSLNVLNLNMFSDEQPQSLDA